MLITACRTVANLARPRSQTRALRIRTHSPTPRLGGAGGKGIDVVDGAPIPNVNSSGEDIDL